MARGNASMAHRTRILLARHEAQVSRSDSSVIIGWIGCEG